MGGGDMGQQYAVTFIVVTGGERNFLVLLM
jgi:hypothetical protein